MLTRRDFLRLSALSGMGIFLEPYELFAANTAETADHFLLALRRPAA
jgi:hypothetical protein